jgi:hypothetical protein
VFFSKAGRSSCCCCSAVCGVVSDRDEVSGGVFWSLCWVLSSSSSSSSSWCSSSSCISLLDGSYFRRRLWAGLLSNYLTSQKLCVVSWWIMVLLVHENVPGLLRGVSFSLSLSLSLSLSVSLCALSVSHAWTRFLGLCTRKFFVELSHGQSDPLALDHETLSMDFLQAWSWRNRRDHVYAMVLVD